MVGIKFNLKLNGASSLTNRLGKLKNVDLTPVFSSAGEDLFIGVQERFDNEKDSDGNPWQRLSAEYEAQLRARQNRIRILQRSGALRRSIVWQSDKKSVQIGSNRVYAATHELGDPVRNIPKRSYLKPSDEEVQQIVSNLVRYLQLLITG